MVQLTQKSILTCLDVTYPPAKFDANCYKVNDHMRTEGGAAISSKNESLEFLEFQAEILDLEF